MELNWEGVIVSAASLLVIGAFHPLVIWCEYRFTRRVWPVFLIVGLLCLLASLLIQGFLSILMGLLGASCLWSIRELQEQAKRVERGWFPENPKRKDKKQKAAIKPARAAGRPDRGAALQQERKDELGK